MVQRHDSIPAQRAQVVCYMISHAGDYGLATHLSNELGVSRQASYTWMERDCQVVEVAFLPAPAAPVFTSVLQRQGVALDQEGHASACGTQVPLRTTAQHVSLVTIMAEAQQRALHWMVTHAPPTSRAGALDEIYGGRRCGAYLNVVDFDSWAIWATERSLPVDTDIWILVLREAQVRGLRWHDTVSAGVPTMQQACRVVDLTGQHRCNMWHLFHACSQIQGRLDRVVASLEGQAATARSYAERVATGENQCGRLLLALSAAHAEGLRCAVARHRHCRPGRPNCTARLAGGSRAPSAGVLEHVMRQAELDTLLEWLATECDGAVWSAGALRSSHTTLTRALQETGSVCGWCGAGVAGDGRCGRGRAGADSVNLAEVGNPGTKHGAGGGRTACAIATAGAVANGELGWSGTDKQCGGRLAQYRAVASGSA